MVKQANKHGPIDFKEKWVTVTVPEHQTVFLLIRTSDIQIETELTTVHFEEIPIPNHLFSHNHHSLAELQTSCKQI